MNLKYISIFLITFFMVVCSPCIFAENVHERDLSYADAVINDTADAVDIIVDNAVVNDSADDGDIIIDNAVVNDSVNDGSMIFPHGPIFPDSLPDNDSTKFRGLLPPQIHAKVERLAPFTQSIAGKEIPIHSIKVRIVDEFGDGIPNSAVVLKTCYTPYNDRGVRLIDMLVYSTDHTLVTDDEGYVVFNYMISPNPEMSVFCWMTCYYPTNPLLFQEYLWWDGINHSIYDQGRDFYK